MAAAARAYAEASAKAAAIRDEVKRARGQLQAAEQFMVRLVTIKQQLAEIDQRAEVDDRRPVLEARIEAIRTEGVALTLHLDAMTQHDRVLAWGQLREQCKPEGLRGSQLKARLARLNADLYQLGKPLPGFIVAIDTVSLEPTLNGRSWTSQLSGAEKWIADAEIQLQLARIEQAGTILLDGADVLSGRNRTRLFLRVLKVVADEGRCVVVAGSGDIEETPDLAGAGIGRTYWVEGGAVSPLAIKAAAA